MREIYHKLTQVFGLINLCVLALITYAFFAGGGGGWGFLGFLIAVLVGGVALTLVSMQQWLAHIAHLLEREARVLGSEAHLEAA